MDLEPYKCAHCGNEYMRTRDDSEAIAEAERYFGPIPKEELRIVCDECWEKMHPAKHPEKVAAARKQLGNTIQ